MDEEVLTVEEVANRLKIAESRVRTLARSGDLPSFRLPGMRRGVRFRARDIEVWIEKIAKREEGE